ncbi:MAG TPA: hypothetical protein ENK98_01780 [Epsilonproteobacteria bacterium]|nr:hypothetical protein [Campylobacterota bacterium]
MSTEKIFLEKEIVKGKSTKALAVFAKVIPDFRVLKDMEPAEYISRLWDKYQDEFHEDNSVNGKILEYILISLLINKNIIPHYIQAKVAFVPNVDFDLLIYSKEKMIALSVKTSLRERYKQADLEAIALKYVHRKAENYLITLNTKEAISVNSKIENGDVIGIDKVIDARSDSMNDFISMLSNLECIKAGKIDIINAMSVVD